MPTKCLPASPNIGHLKQQAKDLIAGRQNRDASACQRIREFHPRFCALTDAAIRTSSFTLSDAQWTIAREYGFSSWARLSAHVANKDRPRTDLLHHERIEDAPFRHAIDLMDDGDADGLRNHLMSHPHLVRQRVALEGGNYFRNPSLLEFVAENPVRHDNLPPNIVEVARVILYAGAKSDQRAVDSTLALVSSGRVARECQVQIPLIDLLCDFGADPDSALESALGHGEFDAVDALVRRGAHLDLAGAAATGRIDEVRRALPNARADIRHRALAWAAQFGHGEIVRVLLDAGEDPNRYNPPGANSHSTPLHQAALAGHADVVRLLIDCGARPDIKDIHYRGTPGDWAMHAGHADVANLLRSGALPPEDTD